MTKRTIESRLDDLEEERESAVENTIPGIGNGEVRIVTEQGEGWIDSLTGEPVNVDEDVPLVDFEKVDT